MKVLVTGSNGFIGKNLISHLEEIDQIEVIKFDKDNNFKEIEEEIKTIDFVFHLAGINRPTDNKEFYQGNTDLTESIISLIKRYRIPILITSSIKATEDSDYGKSKKMAEDLILSYGKKTPAYVYRLHNVFGKWCRPNYNSVVATFCHNIANNLDISINDPKACLELIYIDDIVKEFLKVLKTGKPSHKVGKYCYIKPKYKTTIGKLAKLIYSFKDSMNSIYVPNTGDDYVKKMYSTYISYLPMEGTYVSAKKHCDERGSFSELVRTNDSGQLSISFSKPGIVRGHHYHHTKLERFIVVKGKAKIKFTNVNDESCYEFVVDDQDVKIVTIPVGYAHSIENIGDEEMILVIWCNELFDEKDPDTHIKTVN